MLKHVAPLRVPDPSGNGKMAMDFWEASRKYLLSELSQLQSVRALDLGHMDPAAIKRVSTILASPDCEVGKLRKTSKVRGCEGRRVPAAAP